MDNLEEMDRFSEKFNLPRLNQEEIEIMNNPITSTEIEAVVKTLPAILIPACESSSPALHMMYSLCLNNNSKKKASCFVLILFLLKAFIVSSSSEIIYTEVLPIFQPTKFNEP